ncbi:hypothetical protein L1987_65179 [Smallanthus sonchifolius]|uniref:Uncharacterized protein n=1 Tax=Smallanthus sonchifolius TaxID=185202 RepID=A0ACB9BTS8_9ASTR|nr:hypothetical protein L1987_65179 [Smallanthus sonchifolius]
MFASLLRQTIVVSSRSKRVVRYHIPKVKKNKKKKNQKNRLKKLGFQILVEFFESFGDDEEDDEWTVLTIRTMVHGKQRICARCLLLFCDGSNVTVLPTTYSEVAVANPRFVGASMGTSDLKIPSNDTSNKC